MAGLKLVVLYPRPTDIEIFERLYQQEHLPLAAKKLVGVTKFIATRVLDVPRGMTPPFHRIAEIYFPSKEAFETCVGSEGGKETLDHAMKISTGGPPVLLLTEEDTIQVVQAANP
jgi:uncharacterized protein (TIGR02118 family)